MPTEILKFQDFLSLNEYEIIYSDGKLLQEDIEMSVNFSVHSLDRMKSRYEKELNIPKDKIENIIAKAWKQIKMAPKSVKTFVLHDLKSNLNIVTGIVRKGFKYLVNVITVMYKDKFYPKPEDLCIDILESNDSSVLHIEIK